MVRLAELLDFSIVQRLANANYNATGMPIGIIDAADDSVLVACGWQDICVHFHRANPESRRLCQESDNYLKTHLDGAERCEYRCQNGLRDIAIPITVEGEHLATLFLGQFFYERETPDRAFFADRAGRFGYDQDAYLAALDRVPVFSRRSVDNIVTYDKALAHFISEMAARSLVQRRDEQAFRQSERLFRALAEHAPDVITRFDRELRHLYANAALERVTGVPSEWLIGKTCGEMGVPPDLVATWEGHLRGVFDTGRPGTCEFRFDGAHATSYHEARLVPEFGPDGTVLSVLVITRDVTERKLAEDARKRSEAILSHAGEMAHLGAWWIEIGNPEDLEANPASWSDEVYRILGYAPGEVEPAPARFFERVPPEDRQRIVDAVAQAIAENRPYTLEHRIVRPDGTERIVLEHAEVTLDDEGRPLRLVGAVQDITEQKRTEEALREADRQKDQFLAMLAHELRNPLGAITSATHLIRSRLAQGQPADRPLEILERQTRNSARLLDDLLDVSRVTRGMVQLQKEQVRLDTVVMSAAESQRALIDSAGHHLAITLPHQPVFVEGDPTRLEQVITNLLNNAAKYTPERGRIALVVEPQDSEVLVRVQDDGIGIPPELLPRIFEPFVQAAQSLARTKGGLGLGLTLVRKLVEMHGGSVEARSDGPRKGSEFVVRLPAKAPPRRAPRAPRPAEARECAHRRILLVEDNFDAAELLADYLQSRGHEVTVAHDGPSAVDAAERLRPEVVLLDIGLPGMDGYEVGERLRRSAKAGAPILIALTGYGQEEDRQRSREAGFAHHLTKPFAPDALERLLGEAG